MKHTFILLSLVLSGHIAIGQAKISNFQSTNGPNTDAILELEGKNKGLLMGTVALENILSASPMSKHEIGIIVFNTATSGSEPNNVKPGLYYNDGIMWQRMSLDQSFPNVGDIKQSFIANDHDGWYLLDGRAINKLPATAQASASHIKIQNNLGKADGRILKGATASGLQGQLGGSDSFSILQTNLPRVIVNGKTSTTDPHTHTIRQQSFKTVNNMTFSSEKPRKYSVLDDNADNVTIEQTTSSNSGEHVHDIKPNSLGKNVPIVFVPRNILANTFIYLGK